MGMRWDAMQLCLTRGENSHTISTSNPNRPGAAAPDDRWAQRSEKQTRGGDATPSSLKIIGRKRWDACNPRGIEVAFWEPNC